LLQVVGFRHGEHRAMPPVGGDEDDEARRGSGGGWSKVQYIDIEAYDI